MREHSENIPAIFNKVSAVRAYNNLTGASLSHWDFDQLGIFEHDEVMLILENGDLL